MPSLKAFVIQSDKCRAYSKHNNKKTNCSLMLICLWCQHKCLHSAYLFQANSGPNSNGCQVSAPKKKNHFLDESFIQYIIFLGRIF